MSRNTYKPVKLNLVEILNDSDTSQFTVPKYKNLNKSNVLNLYDDKLEDLIKTIDLSKLSQLTINNVNKSYAYKP